MGRGHRRSNGSSGPSGLGVVASRSTRTLVTIARLPPRSRNRLIPSRSAPQLERAPEPTRLLQPPSSRSVGRAPGAAPPAHLWGGPPYPFGAAPRADQHRRAAEDG